MPVGYLPAPTTKKPVYQAPPTTARPAVSQTPSRATATSPAGAFYTGGMTDVTNPFVPPQPSPSNVVNPGNNLTEPGYNEQSFIEQQNRLATDPFGDRLNNLSTQASQPSAGQNYMDENLGTLDGPGQGSQYWSQVSGQFQDPFAGEQFTREATQNFSPSGPAGAFYDQAMGQYDDFTGYSGPQNAQGQYNTSQQQIGNGTQGQQNMAGLAGQYDQIGQYGDPNLSAGQYAQTQGAFGDMPIANFDPFYDRARQLGVQGYNQDAAGRGVYGSSEALSGVGNVITDIEAQRANRSFDAEMQRAQEQRMRQQLLGEQARMGDLSSLSAFGANLAGVETFGNLNNQMGQLQNQSVDILGNQANAADTQALGAQNANLRGVETYGNLANSADAREIDRYTASTSAMDAADDNQRQRIESGANIADMSDDNERADYDSSNVAANMANDNRDQGINTAANIADIGSDNDLGRLTELGNQSESAEGTRLARQISKIDSVRNMTNDLKNMLGGNLENLLRGSQEDFENWFNADMAPELEKQGYSQQQIDSLRKDVGSIIQGYGALKDSGGDEAVGDQGRHLDQDNPYD